MDDNPEILSTLELFRRQCAREDALRIRPIECDNDSCPSRGRTSRFYEPTCTCSGCSEAKYCSSQCQDAAWDTHRAVCTVPSSVSTAGVHIRVLEKEPLEESPQWDSEYSARTIVEIEIQYARPGAPIPTKVGHAKVQVIDLVKTEKYGFFDCLNEYSHQLGELALYFDPLGHLNPNRGCWQPEDFDDERYLVYLQELVVDLPWRGKGVGGSILHMLFNLNELHGADFIFTLPSVLNHLEPPSVNGPFGESTPEEEAAWVLKRDRIIQFYRKSGFRRLANSAFFCFAKDAHHASHAIPIDADADFEELPPPTTDAESLRRYMVEH